MTVRRATSGFRRAAPLALLLLTLAAVGAPTALLAQGGPAGSPPAQGSDPATQWGAKFFDDAIRYVARGRGAMPVVRDFYAKLDAKIVLDTSRQEGQMRVWFQSPNRWRQEVTTNGATTTKILSAEQGWIRTPDGRTQNLALSSEGADTIKQLKEDRERIADLTQFLTLQALKGPGVVFRFDGRKQGSGTYAGDWIKVTRIAPGRSNLIFWFAHTRDASGNVTATWPGIIRVEGEPAKDYPTEDYLLKEWDSPNSQQRREFRYPRRIEAYSILKTQDGRTVPQRFLFAIVDDIKINAGVDPSRFSPN